MITSADRAPPVLITSFTWLSRSQERYSSWTLKSVRVATTEYRTLMLRSMLWYRHCTNGSAIGNEIEDWRQMISWAWANAKFNLELEGNSNYSKFEFRMIWNPRKFHLEYSKGIQIEIEVKILVSFSFGFGFGFTICFFIFYVQFFQFWVVPSLVFYFLL